MSRQRRILGACRSDFEIVSGPASIAGNTITLDGAAGTVVVRATQQGNADWLAAPPVDRSFAVVVPSTGGPMPTGYCSSTGSQPWQSWNQTVRFVGIDHDSQKEKYGDFTSLEAQVQRGSAYPIELVPAYSWEQFLNTWRVYIDWTRDGDFDDPGELALDVSATNQVVNGQIVVPSGASQGTTRMRVTMKRNSPAGACESFTFGEVQDYAVVISGDGGGEQQAQTIDFGVLPDRPVDSAPFDIAASASSGLPVAFEIVSGPGSISGATITLTGSLGTIVVRATQAGNGSWFPAPPVERSFAVVDDNNGGGPMPIGYCSSIGSQPWQSWNDVVRFIQIDHDSEKERYGDFTDQIAFAARASIHDLELVPAYSWEQFLNTWRVWVDWNRDGDWDDAGELVADVSPTNQPVTVTLTVPSNASAGTTRMRVTMKRNQPAGACESFTFGEVQDYAVEIQ